MTGLRVEAFDYPLPDEAIAQTPAEPRDRARLLVDTPPGRPPAHRRVSDLPGLLRPGDVLVVNDSRVAPARLRLRKQTGGSVEVLLVGRAGAWWEALVRPSRRVPEGSVLVDDGGRPWLEVGAAAPDGRRLVRPWSAPGEPAVDLDELTSRIGEVPLPPYITTPLADTERYQTVYSAAPTSLAAPTAGLHFTDELLRRCRDAGAELHRVHLGVGLATFRPMSTELVDEHPMHLESYRVPETTMRACESAERVVAVGTTTVRALEAAAATGVLDGSTSLFIRPGHRWAVVDVLMTNFHLPRSSLLVLVEAFTGPRWRDLYRVALAEGYRFLSFGDAMIVARGDRWEAGDALA